GRAAGRAVADGSERPRSGPGGWRYPHACPRTAGRLRSGGGGSRHSRERCTRAASQRANLASWQVLSVGGSAALFAAGLALAEVDLADKPTREQASWRVPYSASN